MLLVIVIVIVIIASSSSSSHCVVVSNSSNSSSHCRIQYLKLTVSHVDTIGIRIVLADASENAFRNFHTVFSTKETMLLVYISAKCKLALEVVLLLLSALKVIIGFINHLLLEDIPVTRFAIAKKAAIFCHLMHAKEETQKLVSSFLAKEGSVHRFFIYH